MKKLLVLIALMLLSLLVLTSCVMTQNPNDPDGKETSTAGTEEELVPTNGLEYALCEDSSSYKVVSVGTATDTNIVIASTYEGLPVVEIEDYAFYCRRSLTEVAMPNSVERIGDYAFAGCSALTKIKISNRLKTIGECAFVSCGNLNGITMPNSLTSIGSYAFSACNGLTDITIPKNVIRIGDAAFNGCGGSLVNIQVADGNTVYHADGNCLIQTNERKLIYGCKASVIPADGSVKIIGSRAFDGCLGLTDITIPDGVETIEENAFEACMDLTNVTLSADVVTVAGHAFHKCISLATIEIGSGVTDIGEGAFYCCESLTSITYNHTKEAWDDIVKGNEWDIETPAYTVHCTDGDIAKSEP